MCFYAQIVVIIVFLVLKVTLMNKPVILNLANYESPKFIFNYFLPITSTTAKPNVSSKSLEEDFKAAFITGVDSSRNKTKTTSSLEKTRSRWDSPTTLKKFKVVFF